MPRSVLINATFASIKPKKQMEHMNKNDVVLKNKCPLSHFESSDSTTTPVINEKREELAQAEAVNSPVRERWSLNKNSNLLWRKVASGNTMQERGPLFAHETWTDNSQLSHITTEREEAILGMTPEIEGVAIR
jgi:hypothetical protein